MYISRGGFNVRNHTLVEVRTDEGITGLGEGIGNAHLVKAILEGQMCDLAIGLDPFNIEMVRNTLIDSQVYFERKGSAICAARAIEIACWDIKGKALGLPVYELLGGKTNGKLRSYASQLQFDWDKEVTKLNDPADYARATEKALKDGYDAVKVDPIVYDKDGNTHFDRTKLFTKPELKLFKARLQAIRDTMGEDGDIIFECHSLLGASTAIQLGDIVEEIGCLYYEEPVNYLNSKLHDKVAKNVNVPIAGGERLYHRWDVRPYLEDQSIDVLQPDVGLCGGFTEAKKVCDYADIYDVRIQAHVCGGPVATAASLHLETAIPNFLIHEHHTYAIKDWNRELCIQDPQPVNGFIEAPDTPGIGIDLNDEVVYRSPHMTVTALK